MSGNFSLNHHVQNGSGAHPASCLLSNGYQGIFPWRVKRPGRGAVPPIPSTPSWRGAYLSTGTALPFVKFWVGWFFFNWTQLCCLFSNAIIRNATL